MNDKLKSIIEEFEKKIGHDDWCKTLKYPNSSWDCNCYMKDSLVFVAKAHAAGREEAIREARELVDEEWYKWPHNKIEARLVMANILSALHSLQKADQSKEIKICL